LAIIIEQRQRREDELREKHKQKLKKIEEIKSLLSEQGLSIDDLVGDPLSRVIKTKIAKNKLPPKYQLTDLEGITHEWTGRGLAPKVFQQHFDRGHSKESCLIIAIIDL
jgi:DNA-binding protein H-NS